MLVLFGFLVKRNREFMSNPTCVIPRLSGVQTFDCCGECKCINHAANKTVM